MAESNGLLNRRTGNRTGGSNPPLSAIFVLKFRNLPRFFPVKLAKQTFECYIVP